MLNAHKDLKRLSISHRKTQVKAQWDTTYFIKLKMRNIGKIVKLSKPHTLEIKVGYILLKLFGNSSKH
jgi:hypothetical protein